jgi:signal transduction histidine kinase
VQESITNARKHSHTREVAVSLHWCPDRLVVEVIDPGPPRRSHSLPGAGMGLRAMAERVRAVGGTVETGRSETGFAVRAALPLSGGPESPS